MKKIILFSIGLLFFTTSYASEGDHQKDPNEVRFVQNNKQILNTDYQSALRARPVWQQFLQKNGAWWVEFDEYSTLPRRAMGNPVAVSGNNAVDKALNFIQQELGGFSILLNDLVLQSNNSSRKYDYIDFKQQYKGREILSSRASVRFNKNGEAIFFALELHPKVNVNTHPSLSKTGAETAAAANVSGIVTSAIVQPDVKILPIPGGESGYMYKLIYEVMVETDNSFGVPGRYRTFVDAHNGEVYYRVNLNHNCFPPAGDITVDADITDNPLLADVNRPLPHLRVRVNGTNYYTDANGLLSLPTLTAPTTGEIYLDGRFAKVYSGASNTTPIVFTTTLNPGTNLITFNSNANPSQRSAYYHVNVVHDHMKKHLQPAFTSMDIPFTTRVDLTSGDCNAFYNGTSINFYAAGGGCPATALFSDVVYHEYGHGINYEYYSHLNGSWNNGAMGEGYSDVWGFSITKDPILGLGFSGGTTTYVRRYDIDPKVYPQDLVGEVHADGEIIAGAWWDTYLNLNNNMDSMMAIFSESHYGLATAFNGYEGQLYRDILVDALLADDNDGNIVNGTPHLIEITSAFAKHGITLLTNAIFTHNVTDEVVENAPVTIDASLYMDFPTYLGNFNVHYRTSKTASFTALPMTLVSGDDYTVNLPAQPKGTIIEYYFTAEDNFQNKGLIQPFLADDTTDPNLRYFTLVGYAAIEKQDYDNQLGNWIVNPDGTDDATTGIWIIGSPIASYSDPTDLSTLVQTGQDHTTDGLNLNTCAVTANASSSTSAIGEQDVDAGKTTLQSPAFDLTTYTDPVFSYWRWYINNPPTGANPGNDSWKVFISNDGQTWLDVERTYTADRSWRKNVLRVSDYVTPTATVYLRFVASDSLIPGAYLNGGSIVEAAVDDLYLYDLDQGIGIDEQNQQVNLQVFPNPALENIFVRYTSDKDAATEIFMTDVTGKIVKRLDVGNQQQFEKAIPVADLARGIYFIKVVTQSGSYTHKVVLQGRE